MRQRFVPACFILSGAAVFAVLPVASQSLDSGAQVQQADHVSLLQTKALIFVPKSSDPFTHRAGLVQTFSQSKEVTNGLSALAASGHVNQPAQLNDLPVPKGWLNFAVDAQHSQQPQQLQQPQLLQQPQQSQEPQQSQQSVQNRNTKQDQMQSALGDGDSNEPAPGIPPQLNPARMPDWLQDIAIKNTLAKQGNEDGPKGEASSAFVPQGAEADSTEQASLNTQPAAIAVSVEPLPMTAPPQQFVASMPDWLRDMAGHHGRLHAADVDQGAALAGTDEDAQAYQQEPSQRRQQRLQRRPQQSQSPQQPQGWSSGQSAEPFAPSEPSSALYPPSPIDEHKFVGVGDAGLPPIGFVKTHKTGGSTVASILHRAGDARNSTFLLPAGRHKNALGWPGEFPGVDAEASNAAPAHQYDIICNHAVYQGTKMRAYLRPNPFFFTVLRDPVEQSKSAFDYFHPPSGKSWDDRLTWIGNVETGKETLSRYKRGQSLRAQFQNPQAHDLGWYEYAGSNSFDRDDAKIDEWLEILDRSLGLVMLTEYFDEGLILLSRKLDLELDELKYVHMKSAKKTHAEPSQAQRTHLQELLHVDMRLYDHFVGKFGHAWTEAGGSALDGELEDLRARNVALRKACSENDDALCPWLYRTDSDQYTELLKRKQSAMLGMPRPP